MNVLLKILLSAALIGLISEVGKRSAGMGALLAALPLVSLLSMIWIYHDTHDVPRVAAFSWSIFWYVLPSLIFFVLLPPLLVRFHLPFYLAVLLAGAATVAGFFVMKVIVNRFGIEF
jgi:hypothetical protein